MKKNYALTLTAVLLLSVFVFGWRTFGQSRPPSPPSHRGWEYNYDTGSKSFPSAADKTKIAVYDSNGWELIAVVHEDYQTALVFKRPRQGDK